MKKLEKEVLATLPTYLRNEVREVRNMPAGGVGVVMDSHLDAKLAANCIAENSDLEMEGLEIVIRVKRRSR